MPPPCQVAVPIVPCKPLIVTGVGLVSLNGVGALAEPGVNGAVSRMDTQPPSPVAAEETLGSVGLAGPPERTGGLGWLRIAGRPTWDPGARTWERAGSRSLNDASVSWAVCGAVPRAISATARPGPAMI